MIKHLYRALLAALALANLQDRAIADYLIKDGNGSDVTIKSFTCETTKQCPAHISIDSTGAELFVSGNAGYVRFPSAQAVTAAQGTAANLNATVVGTGTFAVQAPITSWAGGTLGSMANYGTSPGAVLVPGVNSFVTNFPAGFTANAGTNLNTSALVLDTTLGTTNTDLGAPGTTACATDNGSCNINALIQRHNQRLTTINTTLNSPFQAGGSIGNTSFAATQATASNLNATVVGTGTFAVQAASTLAAETTKVIGTVRSLGNAGAIFDAATGAAVPANALQLGYSDGTNLIAGRVGAVANVAAATGMVQSLGVAQYNATPLTVTDTRYQSLQSDVNGFLKVNVATATGIAQGSTTSGQTGSMIMGAVTTAAPTYTTAQTSPISLQTDGSQRVAVTNTVAITANSAVNVAQINGVTPLMGAGNTGTGSPRVTQATDQVALATWGHGATGATAPTGATNQGCIARSSETTVTNGQMAGTMCDLVGKQVVLPFANPENGLNGIVSTAMTGTTSTAVSGMGAQGAGVRVYVTACTFDNEHATVGTTMILQDGSGGTTLWQAPAAPAFGGAHVVFPTPIKTTTNTALFAANVTTGASTKLSCTGYKGA